ncbi:MAG: type II toxin-antitoxin system VapC family toxin [Thermoleophilaceae bacterium]
MIVLDTHALIWLAAEPERLGDGARDAIAAEADRAISTISAQEIAYLVLRGRIELDRPVRVWIADVLRTHEVRAVAPGVAIAVRAGSLDAAKFPGDPADRLIYATALEHGGRVASADERLRALDPARIIW